MTSEKLGGRIRDYRERLGLSTEDLARNAGLDTALIEVIEEGDVYPAIGVLVKLARALGQRVGTFMDDQYIEDPLIVKMGEREEETASHKGGAEGHYHYYPLGKGKRDRHMEPFFIEVDPRQRKTLSSHEGEEFVMVMSESVELVYGGKTHHLKEGDSVYYNSIVPHHLGASGEKSARILAVVYTPF